MVFAALRIDAGLGGAVDSRHFRYRVFPLILRIPAISKKGVNVNKNDLVAAVAANTGLSKSDSANSVDSVIDAITGALKGGQEVRLVGFGTFSVAQRAASQGRNPRTGERINIPASRQPKFKAGKALKAAVN